MVRILGTLAVGLAVVAVLGCNQAANTLGTLPVSGVVTLDGQPVQGAKVVFAPTGGSGTAASGVTDATGHYKLTTQNPDDGAMPGSYAVMISKTEVGESAASSAVKPGMTDEEATKAAMEAYTAGGSQDPEVKDLLPAKYKSPSESGLKADVAAGKAEFNFDLKSE